MTTTNSRSSQPSVFRLAKSLSSGIGYGALSAIALLLLLCASIEAQTAHFGYALSTLGSGFSQPTAAALDASGNLFVTDESNQAVYELTAASGYSTVITICTQFTIPTGVAVDANDNVFVTDQGTATVNELLASSNYATVRTLGSGFSNPNGVAVDSSGDVFVADTLNNAIKEMIAVSGSIPDSPTINTLGGSYNHPTNLAVDSSGNVFVADLFNSAIKEIVAAGGYVTVNTLGSGFSYPVAVALDANDNVYVADSGNNAIKEILAAGGYTTVNTLASSLPYPTGVAVNSAGNVYIANFSGSTVNLLTLFGGVGFGSLPVATSTPQTIQLTFIFDTSGTIGAPLVRTKGDAGLDFADAGTGTCTTNGTSHTYMAGDTCTVAASFTPTASGMRYGGVNLTTNGGAPIATEYVSGIGVGPQAAFYPGSQSSFAGSFLHPTRIAVDAAGNIFVAVAGTVSSGSFVQEILAAGGYVTVNSLGSGYSYPEGIAVDGSGNVFVADTYNNAVEELLAAGGYTTMNTIGADFTRPYAVAVDANGNVFVADTGNNAVKEILAAGGYTTVNTLGSGFSAPRGVAVDANGNVFVADTGNNAVKEIMAAGGYTTINAVGASLGLYAPSDLSLDGNGNLYVITQFGIGELFAASGYTTGGPVFISVPQPVGITVDAKGDVFVTDNQNSQIDELDVVDPPSFSFASTAVGATSSPQEAEIVNNGNAPLTIEIPTTGRNPSVSSGFTYLTADPACPQLSTGSSAATVSVEEGCVLGVTFAPTVAGSITGSLVLTDNALNATGPSYATQTIALSGTATNPPITATTAVASAVLTRNFAVTPFVPVTGSGGYGGLTYSIAPALPAGLSFSTSTGTVSGTPTAVSASTTYTVTVTDPATVTNSATFALTVNSAVAAATAVASKALTQNQAAAAFVPVTGSGGTGTLTYSIAPTLPAGLSFSSVTGAVSGTPTAVSANTTYTVTATDTNGASATATFTLAVNAAVTATTAVASEVLTQKHAVTAFTPVTGAGGTGALTYSIAPMLPAGLSFSSATGAVSGTATAVSSTTTYTVTATDTNGAMATATFTLAVNAAVTATTAVRSEVLTQKHAITAFTPVTGTGGTGTLTYSIAPTLPVGLSFSSVTGAVSGTPTAVSANTTYTITVTDSNGSRASGTFTLTVNAAVTATTAVTSKVLTENSAVTAFIPVTGAGGTGTLTYSIAPTLPAGLSFSSASGAVGGTPTAVSSTTTYTVTVIDTNGASSTATFTLAVNNVLITTTTGVTSSNPSPTFGSSIVLTAAVSPAPTANPPGTVSFYTGSTLLGTSALNSSGVATLSIVLPQGSNSITAVYSGSAQYSGSKSDVLSVSALAATAVAFSASPTTQLYNNPIVLTVQVTSATSGTMTGTVTFLDQTTVLATVPIGANGTASYTNSNLAQGSHSLTAIYSGDGNFQSSASTGTGISITVGNINLDLGNDQNQSVVPGAAVSYSFPLSPLVTPTFLYKVQLTATGLPPGATYTFSPSSIPAGSGSMPVTLTVQTAKGTASVTPPTVNGNSSRGLSTLAFVLMLPLLGLKRVRQRINAAPKVLAVLLFAAISLCATLAVSGCGASGFFGQTSTSGTYNITVTATSADLIRTSTVQLTIQ